MITRVFKHIFSDNIKKVKEYNLAPIIVELLNTLFARFTRGGKGSYSGVPSYTENTPSAPTPTPSTTKPEDKKQEKKNINFKVLMT